MIAVKRPGRLDSNNSFGGLILYMVAWVRGKKEATGGVE